MRLHGAYPTPAALERAISNGSLDLGVVVPYEFARQLGRGQTADVQVLINGVTFVATMARSATQAQLVLFFVNPPLMALSGAFTPIEAMPKWIQPFTYLNPIAHFAGRRVRAAPRARRDRDGAGWIQCVEVPGADELAARR